MRFFGHLLLVTFLTLHFHIFSQDRIFRKNGEIISAKILEKTNRYCSYRLFGQADTLTRFLSVSAIDSIIYYDGRHEIVHTTAGSSVIDQINENAKLQPPVSVLHNRIGADVIGLLYKSLRVSYEFLPGKARWGYKASFSKNLEKSDMYINEYLSLRRNTHWLGSLGVNYYFFPPGTFRIGTGLDYLAGSGEEYIYQENVSVAYKEKKTVSGIAFNLTLFYRLSNDLTLSFGTEYPVITNVERTSPIASLEILLSF